MRSPTWIGRGPSSRLCSASHEYHKPLTGVVLLDDWEARQREHVAFGTDEALVLIARSEGRAIGFTNARIARNPSIFEERFGAIDNMYVLPEARRLRVGFRMLETVEAWCRTRGVDELRLGVAAANEGAVAFWEASEFTPRMYAMSKRLL